MKTRMVFAALLLAMACLLLMRPASSLAAEDKPAKPKPGEVLAGLRAFLEKTALADGSFRPGIDPAYEGLSDSAYSDLAPVTYAVVLHKTFGWKLPHEAKTRGFLLSRQKDDGAFFNVKGTADPKAAQARLYNTTQGIVALHALGAKPRHDPLPVLETILQRGDFKKFPAYTTSFFPLAYEGYGKAFPPEADRKIRPLLVQADDGYVQNHIAATFHMVHYYRLLHEPTPRAEKILDRVVHDQKPDGSWLLNPPSWDRHAGFDAVFVLRQLGANRADCRQAISKAAAWALTCRNADGGFGHYPGCASDMDAVYFQVGTLVMAQFLKPVEPPPADPHLLSWGHFVPVP
jgi:hypothetical protein